MRCGFDNFNIISLLRYDVVNHEALPTHWRDEENPVSSRSEFLAHSSFPHLRINSTKEEDVGQYKCRVDYVFRQTTFHVINLSVIVPPSEPRIFRGGEVVERWIPVRENQSLALSCQAEGGNPLPNITWWQDDTLLNTASQQ